MIVFFNSEEQVAPTSSCVTKRRDASITSLWIAEIEKRTAHARNLLTSDVRHVGVIAFRILFGRVGALNLFAGW